MATVVAFELTARVMLAIRLGEGSFLWFPYGQKLSAVENDSAALSYAAKQGRVDATQGPKTTTFQLGDATHDVTLNDDYFRYGPLTRDKGDRFRVFCLGASSTHSAECPDGQTYPDYLERMLREAHPGREIQVINAGIAGGDTDDILWRLRNQVLEFAPDVVTFMEAFNDCVGLSIVETRWPLFDALYNRSLLYSIGFNVAQKTQSASYHQKVSIEEEYRDHITQMVQLSRDEGFRLVFVQQPMANVADLSPEFLLANTGEESLPDFLVEEIRSVEVLQSDLLDIMGGVARENGITLVDPRPAFRVECVDTNCFYIFLHPIPAGSELLAREIHTQVEGAGGWGIEPG